METLDKIFCKAEELFMRYGLKSVTMDDIASALGVSKKTLYQFVSNKTDLVKRALNSHLDEEKANIRAIRLKSVDAIQGMFEIGMYITRHLKNMNPSVIYDMEKYYPEAWKLFFDYKHEYVYQLILENIERGINEGLYRNDFNPKVVAKIYVGGTDSIIDPDLFPWGEFQLADIYAEYLKFYIRGIASEKGLKVLDKLKPI